MRLPEGKQRLCVGSYFTMTPVDRGHKINLNLVIKWYAWPFLMWKAAHKECIIKWYQYPKLVGKIAWLTLKKWLGKE